MLLTGPFGGLTDDVREFLRCLDGDGLLLTGWGELDPASLRTVGSGCRPAAPAATARPAHRGRGRDAAADRAGARVPRPADAAQLGFVFAAWWEGVDWGDWAPRPELGRLLWHERDALLQELAGLPPGARSTWPASPTASGSWSATAGTAPALLAAAAAMSGPSPPSLASATAN